MSNGTRWTYRILTSMIIGLLLSLACAYAHGQSEDEMLKTPAVLDAINELHAHTHLAGYDKAEWSFVIRQDGTPSKPQSSHEFSQNHLSVAIGSDRAIIHSHPDGTSPQPSNGDLIAAKHCKVPNYEISGYHIYVAEPDGKTIRKVADIEQAKHGVVIHWGTK